VVGETPNLAARLRALAEPGSVVIASATRRLLGNVFRVQGLGRHEVKGLSEPVEAWAVEGTAVAALRSSPQPRRCGRYDDCTRGTSGYIGPDPDERCRAFSAMIIQSARRGDGIEQ
jgi:hypothetical protein